jgi:DNA mismatch endonuclease (patch repair protein)
LGLRFRLHRKDLPGQPDIVLVGHRTVVFVHGCFWHRHSNCRFTYTPKSNIGFWLDKFKSNVDRDRRAQRHLRKLGWRVIVIWECQATNAMALAKRFQGAFRSIP